MVPATRMAPPKGGMRFLLRDIITNKTLFQRSDKLCCDDGHQHHL